MGLVSEIGVLVVIPLVAAIVRGGAKNNLRSVVSERDQPTNKRKICCLNYPLTKP